MTDSIDRVHASQGRSSYLGRCKRPPQQAPATASAHAAERSSRTVTLIGIADARSWPMSGHVILRAGTHFGRSPACARGAACAVRPR
jgi:hypothetical protein